MTTAEIEDRPEGALTTLRRGLRMMPEFRRGLPATFALALMATAGRVVVPIAVQQVIDRGLAGSDGPDLDLVRNLVAVCAVVVVLTGFAVYRMNVRAVPHHRDGAGRPAHPRLPARARPVGAAPAGPAPRIAGLAGDQRRRPAVDVHAVGRRPRRDQRRAAARRDRRDVRVLVAAHPCSCWPASSPWPTPCASSPAGSPWSTAWSGSGSATCWPPCPSRSSAPPRCAPTASGSAPPPASTRPSTGTTGPRWRPRRRRRQCSSAASSWPRWPTPR